MSAHRILLALLLLVAPLQAQSPDKPAYIRYYTVDETFRDASFRTSLKTRSLEKLKDLGVPAQVVANGTKESLILAGPFTSVESFNEALGRVRQWQEPESSLPYYLSSARREDEDPPSSTTAATAEQTVHWLREFTAEHNGVDLRQALRVDSIFYTDAMIWDHDCMPGWWLCYNKLRWSTVRKVKQEGRSIALFGQVDGMGHCCSDNHLGRDMESGPRWVRFQLSSTRSTKDDSDRLFKAVKHLLELAGADLNSDETF